MNTTARITINKNGYYAIRFRLHPKLIPFFRRESINKSLKTQDYEEAKVKADTIHFKYKKIVEVLNLLSDKQIEDIVSEYIQDTLDEDKKNRAMKGYGLVYAGEGGYDTPFEDSADASNDVIADYLYDYRKALANSDYSVISDEGAELLESLDIKYNEQEISHQLFLQRYLRGKIEVLEESFNRNNLKYNNKYDRTHSLEVVSHKERKNINTAITLQEALTKYKKWYSKADITPKQYNATINKLERTILPYFGFDTRIDAISTDSIDEFKEYLAEFPNISRLPYKHMNYDEIKDISFVPEENRIGTDTQCKYLKIVKQFFKYLCDANELKYNPCSLLRMPNVEGNSREPFTVDEIKSFFKEFETLDDKKYIYYILAYTGMRPNELWKADICEEGNIFYFDLTDSDLDLKTAQSKRKIPLHKTLIEMDIKDRFEELKKQYKQERISTYFNQVIKPKYISDEENKIMYSFRHTVATELKRAEVYMDKVSELLGHSYESKTMTKTVYASPYSLMQLKEAIDKLQY